LFFAIVSIDIVNARIDESVLVLLPGLR